MRAISTNSAALVAVGLTFSACRPVPLATTPRPLPQASSDAVERWIGATVPGGPLLYRFSWRFTQADGETVGGAGSARLAPPDSLRLDFAGPLGVHRTAASVVGDTVLWISPSQSLEGWQPSLALAWGLLGVSRRPRGWNCPDGLETEFSAVWQCQQATDTVQVEAQKGLTPYMHLSWWSHERPMGQIKAWTRPDGTLVRSEMLFYRPTARLEITIRSVEQVDSFPAAVWEHPVGR